MGFIFYLMGKSSSGKDTIYKKLIEKENFPLKTVVGYTTRPIRKSMTVRSINLLTKKDIKR